MYQVRNKWALITGAARGIGYLTARFMAEQGCNLILHSRSVEHTEKVHAEVRAMGVSAYSVAADLNDLASVERMLREIDQLGVFVDDRKSGRYLGAQNFAGMTLEDAVRKAEAEFDSPYHR